MPRRFGRAGPAADVGGIEISSVQDHYERLLAAHYTWMSGGHESQVARNRELLLGLGVAESTGERALDLGCGSGFQSLALAGLGYEVVAVDTSRELLDELEHHAAGRPITTVHGDMLDSSLYRDRGPFAVAVCMGDTLTHVQSSGDVGRLFAGVRDCLTPGGILVLSFRDLSHELQGADRAIPVRLEDDRLMATFLEYEDAHINVHDMVFEREAAGWQLQKSAYRKLRLSGPAVVDLLEQHGYADVTTSVEGMTFVTAHKPAAS